MAASSSRMASGPSSAHGREPNAPAFDAAVASALPCTPAIGAWMTGSSVPRTSRSFIEAFETVMPVSDEQTREKIPAGRERKEHEPANQSRCLSRSNAAGRLFADGRLPDHAEQPGHREQCQA